MTDLGFLFAGMAAAWLVVFAYLWHLARRTRQIGRQLESAQQALEEGSTSQANSCSRNDVPGPSAPMP